MKLKWYGLLVSMVILSIGVVGCVDNSQRARFEELTGKGHSAVTAGHRFKDEWWGVRHQGVLDRVKQGNVDLILVGDSITHGWESGGAQLWEKYYAPRNAVNMGFSGDQTGHVLWRFEHGEIDDISPKVAVVLIGVNNIWDNSAEEISDGIKAVCLDLRNRLPKTKVLLLGVFPYQENPGEVRDKIIETNKLASEIADGRMIHFLDFDDKFLRPDKTMSADIMPDFLHPNATGYKIWAEAMEPKLAELMGKR